MAEKRPASSNAETSGGGAQKAARTSSGASSNTNTSGIPGTSASTATRGDIIDEETRSSMETGAGETGQQKAFQSPCHVYAKITCHVVSGENEYMQHIKTFTGYVLHLPFTIGRPDMKNHLENLAFKQGAHQTLNKLFLNDKKLSTEQAVIDWNPLKKCFQICVCGKNKLWVNGNKIDPGDTPVKLMDGSRIKFREYCLYFNFPNSDVSCRGNEPAIPSQEGSISSAAATSTVENSSVTQTTEDQHTLIHNRGTSSTPPVSTTPTVESQSNTDTLPPESSGLQDLTGPSQQDFLSPKGGETANIDTKGATRKSLDTYKEYARAAVHSLGKKEFSAVELSRYIQQTDQSGTLPKEQSIRRNLKQALDDCEEFERIPSQNTKTIYWRRKE